MYKDKHKEGVVERAQNEYEVIVRSLFKKETDLNLFSGLKVTFSSGEKGVVEGGFGQSGKVKVRVPGMLQFILNIFLVTISISWTIDVKTGKKLANQVVTLMPLYMY